MVQLRYRKNEKPRSMDQRVRAAIGCMNTKLRRKLTPIEIAHSVCLSPSHLRHLFKTETDTSLAHYLKELRSQRAKYVLEPTTFVSFKEVATTVGISRVSHFVRHFKTAYRVTPAPDTLNATATLSPNHDRYQNVKVDTKSPASIRSFRLRRSILNKKATVRVQKEIQ